LKSPNPGWTIVCWWRGLAVQPTRRQAFSLQVREIDVLETEGDVAATQTESYFLTGYS